MSDGTIKYTDTQVKWIEENVNSETMGGRTNMYYESFNEKHGHIMYVAINGKLYDLTYIEKQIKEQGIK